MVSVFPFLGKRCGKLEEYQRVPWKKIWRENRRNDEKELNEVGSVQRDMSIVKSLNACFLLCEWVDDLQTLDWRAIA